MHDFNGPYYIKLIYDISEPIYIATFDLGSKIFRFAFLAYAASHSLEPEAVNHSLQYMGKFYKYMRTSTDVADLEVVMACYMAFSYESTQPNKNDGFFDSMLVHFNGMCGAVRRLGNRTDGRTESIEKAIQDIFLGMLTNVLWKFNSLSNAGKVDLKLLKKVGSSLELAMEILYTDYPFHAVNHTLHKLCALEDCFNLYLTIHRIYKLRSTRFRDRDGLTLNVLSLQKVVREIGRQVFGLPGSKDLLQLATTNELPSSFTWGGQFGESWATRLFAHSTFICNITNISAEQSLSRQELERRAKAVCFLYSESQLYSDEWIFLCEAVRGLFWAGLVLTQSIDGARNHPLFGSNGAFRKSIHIHKTQ